LAYFDFDYVTDPPNDEQVNHVTQINNNWQEVANKINCFNQKPANFTGITVPIGTEALDPSGGGDPNRIAVWDGTGWRKGLNHGTAWGSWSSIALRSPTVERTGFTPKMKVNTFSRKVVLAGGVYFNVAQDPWPTNTTVEITTDTAISTSFTPAVSGISVHQGATGQITTASGFASAVVGIESLTSPTRLAIRVRYQGDAGGGNFVMLDGISWWY
jgi:hypothetical protein